MTQSVAMPVRCFATSSQEERVRAIATVIMMDNWYDSTRMLCWIGRCRAAIRVVPFLQT